MHEHEMGTVGVQNDGINRRTIVKGAAWSLPVIAAAVAAPLATASGPIKPEYGFTSTFGVGWYPNTVNHPEQGGVFQYDTDPKTSKYHHITGTKAGDVVSGVYVEFAVSDNHPQLSFYAMAGSNPDWTVPTLVRQESGRWIYRFDYTKTVIASGSTVDIPIGFFFRADTTRYFSGVTVQTSRYATVNAEPVFLVRNPATLVNTNVPVSSAPRP